MRPRCKVRIHAKIVPLFFFPLCVSSFHHCGLSLQPCGKWFNEEMFRLWDAGGVCHHGYRDCARAFELRSEGQLVLGLRARLVLELCRTEQTLDLTKIQKHLDRIRSLTSTEEAESGDAEVELSESNFVKLVESLLKDPSERENFYQDVFPVEFGPKYDTAIQMLMLEFLSRLEKLLPIPDLEQTASLLNAVPSARRNVYSLYLTPNN
nr:uncharacterized protein LOC112071641 isoform X2 [Salvelinus alpinus]XP_023994839.1 uncharacterized protein LOC112071641 isoform X2 [Salvelinus alpinus]